MRAHGAGRVWAAGANLHAVAACRSGRYPAPDNGRRKELRSFKPYYSGLFVDGNRRPETGKGRSGLRLQGTNNLPWLASPCYCSLPRICTPPRQQQKTETPNRTSGCCVREPPPAVTPCPSPPPAAKKTGTPCGLPVVAGASVPPASVILR